MDALCRELIEPPRPVVAFFGPFSSSSSASAAEEDKNILDKLVKSFPLDGAKQALRAKLLVPHFQEENAPFDVDVSRFHCVFSAALPRPRRLKGSLSLSEHSGSGSGSGSFIGSSGSSDMQSEAISASSAAILPHNLNSGILKANWLRKHVKTLPAVVVLLFQSDGDSSWKRVESVIIEEVERVRKVLSSGTAATANTADLPGSNSVSTSTISNTGTTSVSASGLALAPSAMSGSAVDSSALQARPVRIVVVITHRSEPTGFDERLKALQKRTDLDARQIVLLARGPPELFAQNARRVEAAIADQARHYYKDLAHRIKHAYQKGRISKTGQLGLHVRHNFKIAFYAEFRQEHKAAHKYYNTSYNCLRDLAISVMKVAASRSDDSGASATERVHSAGLSMTHTVTELKAVGEYINFQLCKILLSLGNLADAVAQFHKHMKTFRPATGDAGLAFEHAGWMARQHLIFGQLLDVLPRTTNVHAELDGGDADAERRHQGVFSEYSPCYYTATAAEFVRQRRLLARKLLSSMATFKDSKPEPGPVLRELPSDAFIPFEPAQIDQTAQTYIGECTCTFYRSAKRVGATPILDSADASRSKVLSATTLDPLSLGTRANIKSDISRLHEVLPKDASHLVLRHAARELYVDYSSTIRSLLQTAIRQFRKRSQNVRRSILALEAALSFEWTNCGIDVSPTDLQQAALYAEANLAGYRIDACQSLLTRSLLTAMRCCELKARSVGRAVPSISRAFIAHGLEYVSASSTASFSEKMRVQSLLEQLLSPSASADPELLRLREPMEVDMLHRVSSSEICSVGSAFELDSTNNLANPSMHRMLGLGTTGRQSIVSLKTRFASNLVYAEQTATLLVSLQSNFPASFPLAAIVVKFSDPRYDILRAAASNGDPLVLQPHTTYEFAFTIACASKDDLTIQRVSLHYGAEAKGLRFVWAYHESGTLPPDRSFALTLRQTALRIMQPRGKLELRVERESTNAPVLQGELHPILIHCQNLGADIISGRISVSLSGSDSELGLSGVAGTHLALPSEPRKSLPGLDIALPSLTSGIALARNNSTEVGILVCIQTIGHPVRLSIMVEYTTVENKTTTTETHVDLHAVAVFSVRRNIYNERLLPLAAPQVSERFLYYLEFVVNDHDVPLVVRDTRLVTADGSAALSSARKQDVISLLNEHRCTGRARAAVELLASTHTQTATESGMSAEQGPTSDVTELTLSPGSRFTVWSHMLLHASGDKVPMGSVEVRWRRAHSSLWTRLVGDAHAEDEGVVLSTAPLPPLRVQSAPYTLKVDTPPFARVGELSRITVRIENHTPLIGAFRLHCADGLPSFLLSGPALRRVSVAPRESITFEFRVLPVCAGRQPLPQLSVFNESTNMELPSSSQVRYLFVNPSATPTRHLR